ncbi:MAG: penicillin acylase family protein [Candidatus Schekmanbacteria bacterium]|nr:penicillin acylase family protein [Candidatus Schekmanbacteria bacterium]
MDIRRLLWRGLGGLMPAIRHRPLRGEITVRGLRRAATAQIDEHGVAHISADNDRDLHFAAGFVCAHDRLFQLELWRRYFAGRLAETFGELQVPTTLGTFGGGFRLSSVDHLHRLLGFREWARASLSACAEEVQVALEASAAGINAYLDTARSRLPIELRVLGLSPEQFSAVDLMMYLKGMAFALNVSWRATIANGRLQAALGAGGDHLDQRRMNELLLSSSGADAMGVTGGAGTEVLGSLGALLDAAAKLRGGAGGAGGSNAWVISGAHTASGAPLLANDTHLNLLTPAAVWEVALSTPGHHVAGGALPGTGLVLIGRNQQVAWGMTLGMAHDTDLYWEQLRGPDRVEDACGETAISCRGRADWERVTVTPCEIAVRGSKTKRITLRSTPRGPLISDAVTSRATSLALSMRWTGMAATPDADAIYRLNRAATVQQACQAASLVACPALSFVFATKAGEIGYQLAGLFPVRRGGAAILPRAAWDPDGEWTGFVPFGSLPAATNPAEGFIVSANDALARNDSPHTLAAFYDPPHRARRIRDVIVGRIRRATKLRASDCAALQVDDLSLQAQVLVEKVLKPVCHRLTLPASGAARWMLAEMLAWDFRASSSSRPAAIFHVFYQCLLWRGLRARLGDELFRQLFEVANSRSFVVENLLISSDSAWFGGSAEKARLISVALADAESELDVLLGPDPSRWTWGRLHRSSFPHALGKLPIVGRLFGISPFPAGGSPMTVNQHAYSFGSPFATGVGPAFRHIADLASPEVGGTAVPPGNCGNPASAHATDQVALWREGRLKRHPFASPSRLAATVRLLPPPR